MAFETVWIHFDIFFKYVNYIWIFSTILFYTIFLRSAAIPSAVVVLVSSIAFWIDPVSDGGARGLVLLFSTLSLTAIYLNTAASYLVWVHSTYLLYVQ